MGLLCNYLVAQSAVRTSDNKCCGPIRKGGLKLILQHPMNKNVPDTVLSVGRVKDQCGPGGDLVRVL